MRTLELLAPAKNLEIGKAAIDHGADAVYIGAPRFGARAAAGNSVADIAELCQYAHRFGARVHVTVNTIIYDNEMEDTVQMVEQLCEAGVDALLVQDMGLLLRLSNKDLGRTELHASTQCDSRTADKVAWLGSLGFRRVVLARELSIDEIAQIHAHVPGVELEVFVHGALCVSYSGLCYASQYAFQRSANRGACAQFCRMKFDLVDAEGTVIERQRHLLSLKDLCQADRLEALAAAGACSFKIEGRLKDLDYVKNVVAAYSQRLDKIVEQHPDLYRRASLGTCRYTFTPNLRKTFNRGFTHYFADGRQPDIFSPDTPKAIGELVGTVKDVRRDCVVVAGTAAFANGDGLCYLTSQRQLEGFRVNTAQGNRLYPYRMPHSIERGMSLYRNNDQAFERQMAGTTAERRIPVTLHYDVIDEGFSLTVATASGQQAVATVVFAHQRAKRPQADNIRKQLTKLGTTVFMCSRFTMGEGSDGWFVPNSVLSDLRRQACEALLRQLVPETRPQKLLSANLEQLAPPVYHPTYLYNAANRWAEEFYRQQGVDRLQPAYEVAPPNDAVVMQCRHCLRYSLGACVRRGGNKPTWHEPLYLVLGDGRRFRLEFACSNCQMNVYVD